MTDLAPSGLIGAQLKLFILEVNYEYGWTQVVQRSGRTDMVQTQSVLGGIRIDSF